MVAESGLMTAARPYFGKLLAAPSSRMRNGYTGIPSFSGRAGNQSGGHLKSLFLGRRNLGGHPKSLEEAYASFILLSRILQYGKIVLFINHNTAHPTHSHRYRNLYLERYPQHLQSSVFRYGKIVPNLHIYVLSDVSY